MENKIILDIVKRDVNEIKALIGDHVEILINPSLVRLTLLKAKALCEGLEMLATKNTEKELVEETEPDYFVDDEEVVETDCVENIIEKPTIESSIPENESDFEEEALLDADIDIDEDDCDEEEAYLEDDGDDVHIAHTFSNSKILGENFYQKKSLNDIFSSSEKEYPALGSKIENLKTAIGLNDRFQYIRELFGNNTSKYEEAINKLNSLNKLEEAVDYLEQNFEWKKSDASLKFIELIKRRYQN